MLFPFVVILFSCKQEAKMPNTKEVIWRFCGECGAKLQREAKYCTECGNKVGSKEAIENIEDLSEEDKKLVGLDGWMSFFILGLIISCGFSIYNSFSYFGLSGNEYYGPMGFFTGLLFLAVLVLEVLALVRIFQKRKSAIKIVFTMMILGVVAYAIDAAIATSAYQSAGAELPTDLYNGIGRAIWYAIIWGLYFSKSKRVRLTLVNE